MVACREYPDHAALRKRVSIELRRALCKRILDPLPGNVDPTG
jgi:hypothetical protein